ncbi:MAG: GNAT family N-acetyltransferase, partial [Rhodocyclaceae bacterium]|nr:GNAT family N-acetyltransferase [Rhodocyclaceae bacterium]
MQIDCRITAESDANDIASLVNRAYRPVTSMRGWTHEAHLVAGDRISPAQIQTLLRSGPTVLVMYRNGTIVACVHVQGDASGAWIGMLATEPAWQAQGLGKCMLQYAETFTAEHFKAIVVRVAVLAARPELIAFYERRGYARTGQIEDYPVDEEIGKPLVEGL